MNDPRELAINPVTGAPYVGCLNCRHLDWRRMRHCAAYPDGIPLPILAGEVAHDRPLPGDHGIRFEPIAGSAGLESAAPSEHDAEAEAAGTLTSARATGS